MHRFRVIQIFRTFSNSEMKEFDKFIKSPFFGGSNYLVSFFNVIKKYHPDFQNPSLKKERVFKKLYPGKKFNEVTLRKLSSDLFDMAMNFLAQKGMQGNWWESNRFLLAELRKRRLYSLFEKEFEKRREKFEGTNPFDYDYLINMHLSEIENINFHAARKMEIENYENNKLFYEYMIRYTMNYALNGMVNMVVYRDAYNMNDDRNMLKDFIENFNYKNFLKEYKKKNYPDLNVLELNYTMMEMFANFSDHSKYYSYKKTLLDNIKDLSDDGKYLYLTKLINCCKLKIRKGFLEFGKEIYSVYKFMVDNEMIVEPNRGMISEFVFNDIVGYGLDEGDTEWVSSFIEASHTKLIPDKREETYNYSRAMLEFSKGNFERSLEHLSVLKGDLSHSKFNIREYTLMNYYELGYFDSAETLVNSLRHFIKNVRHISEEILRDYSLFLHFYSRLMTAKRDNKKENAALIMTELGRESFPEKQWLLCKAEELKKK